MRKKILNLMLAAALVCALLPTAALAAAPTEVVPPKYTEVGEFHEGYAQVSQDGKWGFIDTAGKEVVPCQYDLVQDFQDGIAWVNVGYRGWVDGFFIYGKWGTVDTTGKEITAPKEAYMEATPLSGGVVKVGIGPQRYGLADQKGNEIIPCEYALEEFSETAVRVRQNGKWGFMSKTGAMLTGLKYDEVSEPSEGISKVQIGTYPDDKYGFVDASGKEIVPCKYDSANSFHEGFAVVVTATGDGPRYGFIDAAGREVVPCKYAFASNFTDGLARVGRDGNNGFIDQTGKEVVPCQYYFYNGIDNDGMSQGYFSEGLAAVSNRGDGNKRGYIDKTGKMVIALDSKYVEPKNFHDGLAAVKIYTGEKDDRGISIEKWGFIDTTGREVLPCTYDRWVADFSEGLAVVVRNTGEKNKWGIPLEKWGVIDKTGKEIVPFRYDAVRDFQWGLATVEMNRGEGNNRTYVGLIDKTGKEILPCQYGSIEVTECSNHLVKAVGAEKTWLFDQNGQVVSAGRYDEVRDLSEDLVMVRLDRKYGLLDAAGQEVVPCRYDSVKDFSEGYAAVQQDRKWGFIDTTGKEVVSCRYDSVEDFSEGYAAVQRDGKWGVISLNGGARPAEPTPVAPGPATAYASTQTVLVDGKPVVFNAYALKDANGNDTNYVKLRDVAQILNGSAAQFQVGWDGSITITTQTAYTSDGSELVQNFTGNQSYTVSTSPVTVNGKATNLEAILLTDASGGGYTYFKLRDLGAALGFNVDWTAADGIIIRTK